MTGSFRAQRPSQKPNIPMVNEQQVTQKMALATTITLVPSFGVALPTVATATPSCRRKRRIAALLVTGNAGWPGVR